MVDDDKVNGSLTLIGGQDDIKATLAKTEFRGINIASHIFGSNVNTNVFLGIL